MSSINSISPDKLLRLIGLAHGPVLIDVRGQDEHVADPRFIPAALLRRPAEVAEWVKEFSGKACVVVDQKGNGDGEGVAAWLRHAGAVSADVLVGGHVAWAKSGGPLIPSRNVPPRDEQGRTIWVTRSYPKVDRIACPWLIRRFVDPRAFFYSWRRRT